MAYQVIWPYVRRDMGYKCAIGMNRVFGGHVEEQAMTQEPLAPIHLSPTKTNTNVNHSNSLLWRIHLLQRLVPWFHIVAA
jgi:hypothetical protein